jgi:hypothetical protein
MLEKIFAKDGRWSRPDLRLRGMQILLSRHNTSVL